ELSALPGEVDQDRAGLENRDRLSVGTVAIDDRGDLVVRADPEELRLELLARADVHRADLVLEAGLLERDVDLVSVWRRPRIHLDHVSDRKSTRLNSSH